MNRDPRVWWFDGAVWRRRPGAIATAIDLALDPHNVAQAAEAAGTAFAHGDTPPAIARAVREGMAPLTRGILISGMISGGAFLISALMSRRRN